MLLPTGRRARVIAASPRSPRTIAEAYAALEGAIEVDGGVGSLLLADANVLRVALAQAGILDEAPVRARCINCGEAFEVRPSLSVELGPYLDDEGDEEWSAEEDDDAPIPPIELPGGAVETAHLRNVTVAEAAPLRSALAEAELTITPEIARALGVDALGSERDLGVIAAALDGASEDAGLAIFELFTEIAYPMRLSPLVRCEACGARTRVDAPALREFSAEDLQPSDEDAVDYPDDEAFEAHARTYFRALTRERGVYGVRLLVEHGVPACDEGGNPLLGAYDPEVPEAGELAQPGEPPTVRVFSRAFRHEFGDAPEVVLDELEETIEHELDHHEAYLSGEDPVHERELDQLVDDERRRVGRTESLRRASAEARSSLLDLVVRLWPFVAIVAAVFAWRECS